VHDVFFSLLLLESRRNTFPTNPGNGAIEKVAPLVESHVMVPEKCNGAY